MQEQDVEQSAETTVDPGLGGAVAEDESFSAVAGAFPAEAAVVGAADPPPDIAAPSFVYAIGQIEPRFPSLAIEKEFAQVIARREKTDGLGDHQLFAETISERENLYLARQMCWCFLVEGLETYILMPRDPGDFRLLVAAVREDPGREDVDVVI